MDLNSLADWQLVMIAVLSLVFLVVLSVFLLRTFVKSKPKFEASFPISPTMNKIDSTSTKSSLSQNLNVEPDSGLLLHKIKKLIEQIDLSLLVNEKEYSNKLYLEARDLYSNRNLNGEDKAVVREDLLRIHKALYKE